MRRRSRHIAASFGTAALVLGLVPLGATGAVAAPSGAVAAEPAPGAGSSLPLVPQPVSVERSTGEFTLHAGLQITATGEAVPAAEYLAEVLRASTGYELPIVSESDAPAIVVDVAPGNAPDGHEAEGYRLDVTADGVVVAASTREGALNGIQTLRQLLPGWVESDTVVQTAWTVPFVSIEDYPRFGYRGLMVDTARSFYTVDEVKRLIDSAAPLKINRLHIHLTDDQGWRIAMDTPESNPSGMDYGLLTEVSGKTAMTYNSAGQLMGTELGRTGFYSKADYTEIVEYADRNGMVVVPEIDMPGHTNAALHAIPQLNSAGSRPQPAPGQSTVAPQGTGDVGNSTFDADNPHTYTFISEVLRQLAELTPGQYLHIGGDEAHSTSREDYAAMVDFATATVADLGKTVVGWNEYADTALPQDDAVVQLWMGDGAATREAVATRGAQVIMSPADRAYMPQKQDARQPLGGTWACNGPCTLENAYNWNPATYAAGIPESAVLGVEAPFWGEFMRGVDQAQFYTFPRLLAIAETGWTPQARKNTADFVKRVAAQGPRLTVLGVNFFPTATVDWAVSAAQAGPAEGAAARAAAAPAAEVGQPVQIPWQVAAPDTALADISARVRWDDGEVSEVPLSTTGVTDIAAMTMNPLFTGVSSRTFDEAGVATGALEVSVSGAVAATAPVTVTIAAAPAPGGPGAPVTPVDPAPTDPDPAAPEDGSGSVPGADDPSAGGTSGPVATGSLSVTGGGEVWPAAALGGGVLVLGLLAMAAMTVLRRREAAQ